MGQAINAYWSYASRKIGQINNNLSAIISKLKQPITYRGGLSLKNIQDDFNALLNNILIQNRKLEED